MGRRLWHLALDRKETLMFDQRPDVISIRGLGAPFTLTAEQRRFAQRRRRSGVRGIAAFDSPTALEDDTGLVLSYSRTPEGVLRGGFSRTHAQWPWAWTLGMFALGWAGGYATWLAIGKRRR
jgi:hypothetical protein